MNGPQSPIALAVVDATHRATGAGAPVPSRYTVEIANAPLIVHVLGELAGLGIAGARVLVAAGDGAELTRVLAAPGGPVGRSAAGIDVAVVETANGSSRHAVLTELGGALDGGPVLLHPGDALFGGQLAVITERYRAGGVDVVLPAEASVATRHNPTDGWLATTAMVLGPETQPLLRELAEPHADGEDLIELLLHSAYRLAVTELPVRWRYEDSTEVLLAGNRLVLDALPAAPPDPGLREGNELHGRIAVGHGAFISGCVIHGPVAIAEGVVLEDSFIGPYTAIGRGAVLSGAEIDNAIVLAGAEIRHPGQRIVASIVGERARVTRSFELPRGMHLRLGPDSQITLS